MRIGSCLAFAAFAVVASAGPRLNDVSFEKKGDGVEVAIKGEGLGTPKILRVKGGVAYILEFSGSYGQKSKLNLAVSAAGLESIQANWFSARPPKVRVAFRIDPSVEPKVEPTEYGYRVVFGTLAAPDAYSQPQANPLIDMIEKQQDTNGKGKVPVSNDTKPNTLPKPFDPLSTPQKQEPLPGEIVLNAKPKPPTKVAPRTINLDFINTEIGIVLKAVALQANVNIATAPDIKGAISVKLDRVTVEQALDIVTAMSGLRWATVNNTYVVAPKEKFSEMMRALNKADGRPSDTRIVPIYSGEVDQIRNAVSRAMPQDSSRGSFDILVPGGETKKTSEPEADPKKQDGTTPAEQKSSGSSANTYGQTYLILVGNQDALDAAQDLIESIDRNICETYGMAYGGSNKIEQDTYLVTSESMSAKSLIDTVRQLGGSAFRNVEMYPSPVASDRQAIIIIGRSTEISRAKKMLEEFDGASDEFRIYDVKFSDPRSLRDELIANIPGLRVTIPAGSAMNPRVYEAPGKKSAKSGAEGEVSNEGSKAQDVSVKSGKADVDGLDLPFTDLEKTAKPMRLVLRGNATQVAKAVDYLLKVDIEPKQIALDLRVMEMSREDALRVGLDWSILTGGTVKSIRFNQGLGDTAATSGTISSDLQRRGSTASILGTLDSIANNRTLLNRPNFVAMDGRETELFVGDVIRYIESIQSSQNGVSVTTNSIRVGVRCAVLARVSGDNQIMMDLRPVVSYLKGYIAVPGGGQLPQTAERMAQSSVLIEDGETIALGGLIKDEDRKIVSGVPILKDLPIVGKLFQRTDNNRTRTEIVFFLTAKVVDKNSRGDAAAPRANVKRNTVTPGGDYPDPLNPPKPKPEPKTKSGK